MPDTPLTPEELGTIEARALRTEQDDWHIEEDRTGACEDVVVSLGNIPRLIATVRHLQERLAEAGPCGCPCYCPGGASGG